MNEASSAPGFSPSEAMASWMHEIAPFGIFTTDRDLNILSWNQWLVSHSGMGAEEVIGRNLFEVFPDLQSRRLADRFGRALNGEISVLSTALHQYLLPLASKAGTGIPFMLQTARIAPLPQAGVIVGTITIIDDVTQRETQAAILLRQQEIDRLLSSSLSKLLQSNDPAADLAEIFLSVAPSLGLDAHTSFLFDEETSMLRLSNSAGLPVNHRESFASMPIDQGDRSGAAGLSFDLEATCAAHVAKLRQIGIRAACAFPLAIGRRLIGLVSFGSYQQAELPASDVSTLARIAGYVAIVIDRTMRERAEAAAARAKDDFLAALSHELRTPLNPVLLLASDSAANPDYPASAREAFRAIEQNALLEARLIDDLLDLTRIEHGKMAVEMQRLDVHATLRDVIGMVRGDASAGGLALEIKLDADQPAMLGDAGRLQQVFWNVLKNAIKFTSAGGRVSVSTCNVSGTSEICIRISDTGIGLEPPELARIFSAFSQGDHAVHGGSHRFGGLGLGLAISRRIVELHEGHIEAASAGRDQGAVFTIFLPVLPPSGPDALPSRGAPEPAAVSKATASAPLTSGRILLVEDHGPTRSTLAHLLVRRGFDVVAVGSLAGAQEEAGKRRFDLVLSDIGLPDGDGFSLMKLLNAQHGLSGIALTGYGMAQDVAKSKSSGFLAHVTKPVDVKTLDRTIAAALQSLRGQPV